MAGAACLSRRQFERGFKDYIGLSPVCFRKIIRFQNLLKKKLGNMEFHLMSLAHECGYSDQAHFSREFRELVGVTPSYYFSRLEYVNAANQCLAISMF
jgi:transcriptional regulator GlxA family with amidase domain